MKEYTLEELYEIQRPISENNIESKDVAKQISQCTKQIRDAAYNGKVKIITDYDADGICSAYIMLRTIKTLNKECDISVICNDRRGSYGVPRDLKAEKGYKYIIMDMGSNELNYILDTFGYDTIVIDHHEFKNERDQESFRNDPTLLNLKSFTDSNGNSSQYCTTGLAYRIFRICEMNSSTYLFPSDEKLDNTVDIMAAIGTIADCVDLMDKNSFNRRIVLNGMDKINNANEENVDFTIGNFLARCGINEADVSSRDIAFKIAPTINAASRMSYMLEANGAQMMFDTLIAPPELETFEKIDDFIKLNQKRKETVLELMGDDYRNALELEKSKKGNVTVYKLPDNVPNPLVGLIASKYCEASQKACIAVTYNAEKGYYTGSCRNHSSISSSLLEFVDSIAGDLEDFKYGGHADAMGISAISKESLDKLISRVDAHAEEMIKDIEPVRLKLSMKEIVSPRTLELFKLCEPYGTGWKLPPVEIKAVEESRDKLWQNNSKHNKKIRLVDSYTNEDGKKEKITLYIQDDNYDAEQYPQYPDGKTIKVLAIPEIKRSVQNGVVTESLMLRAVHDESFLERVKTEIKAQKNSMEKG